MEWIHLVESGIAVVSTLTTGGILGWLFKARFIKRHEEISIEHEVSELKSQELKNAEAVIQLYKNALEDLTSQSRKMKDEYESQINSLMGKLQKYESDMAEYTQKIREQTATIDSLTKSQVKLKMEIMSLKLKYENNTENLNIANNESIDDSSLLSDL